MFTRLQRFGARAAAHTAGARPVFYAPVSAIATAVMLEASAVTAVPPAPVTAVPPARAGRGNLRLAAAAAAAAAAAGWLGLCCEARAEEAELPGFSHAEVATHGSEEDCWVMIDDFV